LSVGFCYALRQPTKTTLPPLNFSLQPAQPRFNIGAETFIPLEWIKGLRKCSENRPSLAFIGTRALLSAINHQIHG